MSHVRLFVVTLGFDVKLVVRQLISRYSVKENDTVIVVTAKAFDQFSLERLKAALDDVEKILDYAGIKPKVIHVDPTDVVGTIYEVGKTLINAIAGNPTEIVLILSGGMRVLVIEVLLAALLTLPKDLLGKSRISIELENLSGYVEIPLMLFTGLDIDEEDVRLMNAISRLGDAPSQLITTLGIPKSTVYRRIRKFMDSSLVVRGRGRYSLTQWGELVLKLRSAR